jgi:hypothetical protein
MNRCKTCQHWQLANDQSNLYAEDACRPRDPDTGEPMALGYEVRMCRQPNQGFVETPAGPTLFSLVDGSTYYAALLTAEAFGCVLHVPVAP